MQQINNVRFFPENNVSKYTNLNIIKENKYKKILIEGATAFAISAAILAGGICLPAPEPQFFFDSTFNNNIESVEKDETGYILSFSSGSKAYLTPERCESLAPHDIFDGDAKKQTCTLDDGKEIFITNVTKPNPKPFLIVSGIVGLLGSIGYTLVQKNKADFELEIMKRKIKHRQRF